MTAEPASRAPQNGHRRRGALQITTSGDLTGEADLSTEQAGSQTAPWLPRPHVQQGRQARGRGASRARTQAAERLTPPARKTRAMERMKHRADFLAAAAAGAKA